MIEDKGPRQRTFALFVQVIGGSVRGLIICRSEVQVLPAPLVLPGQGSFSRKEPSLDNSLVMQGPGSMLLLPERFGQRIRKTAGTIADLLRGRSGAARAKKPVGKPRTGALPPSLLWLSTDASCTTG